MLVLLLEVFHPSSLPVLVSTPKHPSLPRPANPIIPPVPPWRLDTYPASQPDNIDTRTTYHFNLRNETRRNKSGNKTPVTFQVAPTPRTSRTITPRRSSTFTQFASFHVTSLRHSFHVTPKIYQSTLPSLPFPSTPPVRPLQAQNKEERKKDHTLVISKAGGAR